MRRQLVPFLLFLSLAGNLVFGMHLYNRDRHVTRVTWGYAVNNLWKHISWARTSVSPGPDGRVSGVDVYGVTLALEDLEGLQFLPYYNRRAEFPEINTIRQFLHYAQKTKALAIEEQGDTGKVSPESVERLAKVREGLELILQGNGRTNKMTQSRNPWNHAEWRDLWREIADGLRQMDFPPLPE
jgi:hypothetical protein